MDKLGFTFYPKDWWSSETFYALQPNQRYIYLECLFLMYSNDGYMKTQKTQFENRMRLIILEEDWKTVTNLFIIENEMYTHVSVNKRMKKTIANRRNGLLGGRPTKDDGKPKKPNIETQNNPPLESEREYKENIIENKVEDDAVALKHNVYLKLCLNQKTWIETIEMQKVIKAGKIEISLKNYNLHLIAHGENKTSIKDYQSHFVNWMNKRNQLKAAEVKSNNQTLL